MNEFTKKELGFLADGVALIASKCEMTLHVSTSIKHLLDKLQSLIDNYCEHEFGGCSTESISCTKCGMGIDDDE